MYLLSRCVDKKGVEKKKKVHYVSDDDDDDDDEAVLLTPAFEIPVHPQPHQQACWDHLRREQL